MNKVQPSAQPIAFESFKEEVLRDYKTACVSRQASLVGRKEVLTGKAKFGIFGDGKEVPQLAMARVFREGDYRSGYYRDQTFMFAIGESNPQQFFAQLYAIPDTELEPASAGRSMNGHFATRMLDRDGKWKAVARLKNSSADISPTAGQMPRLLGLAYASKIYRNNKDLHDNTNFSNRGNEVAFGTIGDASTSEGLFWETINAAGVLQVPMAISVWDDGYGISVPAKYQTTKQNISEILKGFEENEKGAGYKIYRAKAWDYPGLCDMYEQGIAYCRTNHVPVLFHIQEVTQPQGHSTSGSHERYKSKERLEWETTFDCIKKMREWMIASAIATEQECEAIEKAAKTEVTVARKNAWEAFEMPIKNELNQLTQLLQPLMAQSIARPFIEKMLTDVQSITDLARRDLIVLAKKTLQQTINESSSERNALINWLHHYEQYTTQKYNSQLFSETEESPLKVIPVPPTYADDAPWLDGREVLNANFDFIFQHNPLVVAFGEDVGKIGDVNQGFAGLQSKYGDTRISDTGIREATIAGQGIGLALRGLRPIAEIQYLDYLLYAIQILSDDLATLSYRTAGGQKAPCIIRTRGHRLEGIWHSGSPMGMIINAIRGIHVLVPRNMTIAAGFYNTLLKGDEPAIVIECLNGYRLKEKLPANIGEFYAPIGEIEEIREGSDITVLTYGSTCRVVMEAAQQLSQLGIELQVIDAQSLLPFDLSHGTARALSHTNKLVIVDEDVPGGASAYLLQQVLEIQGGFKYLDVDPLTITAKAHRPAYGSDGDYFSKPNAEEITEKIYTMMHLYNPSQFPKLY
ncbi:MAG: hypothetical protein RIQ89_339 [Bacteroidota bacterium]